MKTKRIAFLYLPIAAISLAISGCTNNGSATVKIDNILAELTGQDGRACLRTSRIRAYAVEDDLVKIRTSNKYYVATTLYRCHDLDLAPRAAFDSRYSDFCGHSAYIITKESRCPVKNIFEFDDREQAFNAIDQAQAKLTELKAEKNNNKGDSN